MTCNSILVTYKSNGREKCSSNQRRPKTKKHAFLRATSMEIVIFMSVWDCKGFFGYENEKSP